MKKVQYLLTAVMAFAVTLHLGATEYTWMPTAAGNYNWNDTANWGGVGFPNSASDVANINIDIGGNQNIRLREDIILGRLNIGDSGTAAYNINLENETAESYSLTFQGMSSSAVIQQRSVGTSENKFSVPVVLASDLTLDVAGVDVANSQRITFNGNLQCGTHNVNVIGGIYGMNQVSFTSLGDVLGTGSIINNSSSAINVDGKKSFSGRIAAMKRAMFTANTGSFTFTGGGFTNVLETVIYGYLTNGNNQVGALIHSGHNAGADENPGQRWTTHSLVLNGGSIFNYGQAAKKIASPSNDWQVGTGIVSDHSEKLLANSGYSVLGISKTDTTAGTVMSFDELNRNAGASLYFNGANAIDRRIVVGNALAVLKGAGGSAGSQTMSIIPWAGAFLSGNSSNPQTFVTVLASGDIRGLADAEYATSIMAGANYNVTVTSIALTSDATVNSLRLDYNGSDMGDGRTLTVASGGVFFFRDNRSIGNRANSKAGTLAFGSAEGVVWVLGSAINTIGAVITGSGGLTKTGTGTLVLTGVNTYSGTNHVGCGTLRVGDGTYESNLGSGDVQVHAGAVLRISCADAIANLASVKLANTGPDLYFGKMLLDSGINETVRYLFLGDEGMPSGTYGGTGSGATNILPAYFAGTGILTVTGNANALGDVTLIVVR